MQGNYEKLLSQQAFGIEVTHQDLAAQLEKYAGILDVAKTLWGVQNESAQTTLPTLGSEHPELAAEIPTGFDNLTRQFEDMARLSQQFQALQVRHSRSFCRGDLERCSASSTRTSQSSSEPEECTRGQKPRGSTTALVFCMVR